MGQSLAHGVKGREILRAADADAVFTALSSDARYQGLDSDLTAIAALTTTNFGRQLLTRSDAADVRSYIGAGTSSSTFDGTFAGLSAKPTTIAGYGISDALTTAQVVAGYQPLDSDLTSIAAVSTTSYGRALLALADEAALTALFSSSVSDQAYAGTLTWTGTTAPSGAATARYHWYRIGKSVMYELRFQWASNGSSLTGLLIPMPSGMPAPIVLTDADSGEVNGACAASVGGMNLGGSSSGAAMQEARMQHDGSSGYEVRLRFGSNNSSFVMVTGHYRCQ